MAIITGDTYAERAIAGTLAGRNDSSGKLQASQTGPQGPAGNTELAYAETTTDLTNQSATSATDVAGLTITFTAPSRPVVVRLFCPDVQAAAAGAVIDLQITDSANAVKATAPFTGAAAFAFGSVTALARLSNLTPGNSYTYKVRHFRSAGTGAYRVGDSTRGATFIQAVVV